MLISHGVRISNSEYSPLNYMAEHAISFYFSISKRSNVFGMEFPKILYLATFFYKRF